VKPVDGSAFDWYIVLMGWNASGCRPPTGVVDSRRKGTLINRLLLCLVISIVVCLGLFSCRDRGPNTVVIYLQGAERQSEDLDQRREIEKALNDMLTLNPDELRTRRYSNYQMEPGVWTIIDVLYNYFLPRKPAGLDESLFYRDVAEPLARAVIRDHLQRVRERIELDLEYDTEETDDEEQETE
jgi:hypothetical protein